MTDGVLEKLIRADAVVLTRLYDRISDPSSLVPISLLLLALPEVERIGFETAYVGRIRAGLFDGSGLEFLAEGEWVPLSSGEFARAEDVFDAAIVRTTYVLKTALPLAALTSWADKFNVPLPQRLRSEFPLDDAEERQARNASPAVAGGGLKRGAKANVDAGVFWAEVERLVDEGLQADPRTAGHTVDLFADAMTYWAERNMQQPYKHSTIKRKLEARWPSLQERSRIRII